MAILIRDPEVDRLARDLAHERNCTLQEAIGHALRLEKEHRAQRRARIHAAFETAQARLAQYPTINDGLTHKEFWDREYGDA